MEGIIHLDHTDIFNVLCLLCDNADKEEALKIYQKAKDYWFFHGNIKTKDVLNIEYNKITINSKGKITIR